MVRQKGSKDIYKADITMIDFYRNYCKNTDLKKRLDRKSFGEVTKRINKSLVNAMIENSTEIRLPFLGYFYIKSIDRITYSENAYYPTDWGRTWKYWREKYEGKTDEEIIGIKGKKVIFHENNHTNGRIYRFAWRKKINKMLHYKSFKFLPTTTNKKKLNTFVRENPNHRYYE